MIDGIFIRGAGAALAAALVCGCAATGGPADRPYASSTSGGQAAGQTGPGAINRRQYFDQRSGRYYYFDQASHRYYWEDGAPRD